MTHSARSSAALRGLGWMLGANVLFTVMSIAGRLASRSAHWSTVAGSRAVVGTLVAFVFALRRGASLATGAPRLSWARSLLGTLAMITTFYAIGSPELAMGDAAVLLATSPLFIAVLSPSLLGERPPGGVWVSLVVAFVGVVLVAGPHLAFASLGAISAILAAIFSALAMMALRLMRSGKAVGQPVSSEAIAFHFGAVASTFFALLNLVTFRAPTLSDAGWLVVAGLSGGLAQLAMTRAYALTEAARLSALTYVATVLTLVASVAFLGERPDVRQLFGSTLVVAAGIALAIGASRVTAQAPEPPSGSQPTSPEPSRLA